MYPDSVLVTVCESLREKFYVANPQMCVWLLFFFVFGVLVVINAPLLYSCSENAKGGYAIEIYMGWIGDTS